MQGPPHAQTRAVERGGGRAYLTFPWVRLSTTRKGQCRDRAMQVEKQPESVRNAPLP